MLEIQIFFFLVAAFQAKDFRISKSIAEDFNHEPRYLKSSTLLIGPEETVIIEDSSVLFQ